MYLNTNWWIAGPAIAVVTLAICIFYWWLLCVVVANTGGWVRLVPHYATKSPPPEGRLKRQSLFVGRCSYRKSITIAATPDGLYLATAAFFRPEHPALLIPWPAILSVAMLDLARGRTAEITIDTHDIPTVLYFSQTLSERVRLRDYVSAPL